MLFSTRLLTRRRLLAALVFSLLVGLVPRGSRPSSVDARVLAATAGPAGTGSVLLAKEEANRPYVALVPGEAVTVTITTSGFNPDLLFIVAGTDVIWRNETGSAVVLNVVIASEEPPPSGTMLFLPIVLRGSAAEERAVGNDGPQQVTGELLFSEEIPAGGSFTYTFATSGLFDYSLAGKPGWQGRVVVDPVSGDNPNEPHPLDELVSWIYSGPDAVQTGVAPGTIDPQRLAVVRGLVIDRSGAPVGGTRVGLLDRPELGYSTTRSDGSFDMVINGGGPIVLDYRASGYLPVQRTVEQTPWLDYVLADTVVLTPLDTKVTTIDLGSISDFAVARGSVQSDDDGTRQATLLFPAGTTAQFGGRGPATTLSTVSVRATEYTVGELGASAMPGNLPPNSGYTYAVEFSVDEAGTAGGMEITFSQPLINYTENLIDAPVGSPVPTGYYDREAGVWVPAENGLVIAIIAESGGMAQVDITGDGVADDATALAAVGINDAERQQLATLYNPGQELWRVKIAHFSPWDHNWPYGPPPPPLPQPPDYTPWPQEPNACTTGGSIISCETQNLSEAIPIAGTPYYLVYNSDRSAGWKVGELTEIELLEGAVPPVDKLIGIRLTIEVAGRRWEYNWEHPDLGNADVADITPNLTFPFQWDGRDAYGNEVSGRVNAVISIGYAYPMLYYEADEDFDASFGAFGDATVQWPGRATCMAAIAAAENPADFLTTCTPYFTITSVRPLQMWTASEIAALGGWTFSAQHFYDPLGKILYYGSGSTAPAEALGDAVRTVAKPQETDYMVDFALGRDGSYYLLDIANGGNAIFRQDPAGNITQIAGNGVTDDPTGDGGPATEAVLGKSLIGISLGPDGSIYFGTTDKAGHGFIRKIDPDGIITTVAGSYDWSGTIHIEDGYPATETHFGQFVDTAVAADGSIYFSEWGTAFGTWPRIRRITPDGIVQTVAGKKGIVGDEDLAGVPAREAVLGRAYGLTLAPDGTLYYGDPVKMTVNRITTDGILTRVAGIRNVNAISGDGGPAIYAAVGRVVNLAIAEDGTLFIRQDAPYGNFAVLRQVTTDGYIYALAGSTESDYSLRDAEPPNRTYIMTHNLGLTVGPDGLVYFGEGRYRVRRIEPALPGYGTGDIFVPSEDGSQVYHFSRRGRHLNTFDAASGVLLTHLSYDEDGLLIAVTDGDGNQTRIERQNGAPVAVVAPWGQRTPIARNGDGLLSGVTNPAGEAFGLTYQAGGLLATFTEAGGGVHRYNYDGDGRLIRDEGPDGFVQTLSRVQTRDALTVTVRTGAGQETVYASHVLTTGLSLRIIGHADGTQTRYEENADGTATITRPDGTRLTMSYGPDPRWGMRAPVISRLQVETPGGQGTVTMVSRSVTLADPANPLSVVTSGELVEVAALGRSYGRRWDTTYSAGNGTYTLTSPEYRRDKVQVDARGRVIAVQEADFLPLTYSYDSRGRVVRIVQGEGTDERVVSLTYDSAGFVSSVTDALGATTTLSYDAVGRLLTERRPDGEVIRYTYDADSNVTSVTPPGSDAYSFSYSPAGALTRYIMPATGQEGGEKSYSYDVDGRLLQATDADGQQMSLTYDSSGRLVSLAMPGTTVGYGFDPVTGQPQSVSRTGGAQLGLSFDGYLLTRCQWSGPVSGTVDVSYDSLLRVAAVEVNSSVPISYTYDGDGLIVGVGTLTLQRNWNSGRLTSANVGTLNESWSYNAFGELETYSASDSDGTLYSISFTRDLLGRLASESRTVGGETTVMGYSYDSLGRLIRVTQDGAEVERYTYDANGNRLTASVRGASASGVYDARDRLTSYGGSTFTYQASGELQTKVTAAGTTTYQYDLRGGLTEVRLADGTQITYVLDGTGRRMQRKVNGTATQGFLYQDSLNPVAELDGTGAVRSRFVYATRGNVPDLMLRDGRIYRIISDYRGSPVLVADVETGDVAQQLRYDAFGNVLQDTNPGFQPFGFGGGLYDPATGLVRFGARDYDPATGRWTAPDPLLFAAGPSNLYSYVDNDPVNYIDPRGLQQLITWEQWHEAKDVHGKVDNAVKVAKSIQRWDKTPRPGEEYERLQKNAARTAEQGVNPFATVLQKLWWRVLEAMGMKAKDEGGSSRNNNRNPPSEPRLPCPPNQFSGQY